MSLTDTQIRGFKPTATPYKRADERGLYLEIFPNGSRLWRFKYRYAGKEKRLAFGRYPDVTLSAARRQRDAARSLIAEGIDPGEDRKREKRKARLEADNSFGSIALEYIDTKLIGEGRSDATLTKARWFLSLLKPSLGERPITAIEPAELLEPLRKIERKGNLETTARCRAFAVRVFRYGVATGRAPFAVLAKNVPFLNASIEHSEELAPIASGCPRVLA